MKITKKKAIKKTKSKCGMDLRRPWLAKKNGIPPSERADFSEINPNHQP